MSNPLTLDVFSDLACPWCFIGKRRLEQALGPDAPVQVRWRAYQLQPGLPPEGVAAKPFFEQKFGGPARLKQIFEHVQGVGAGVGIAFDFLGQERAPNTRLAHEAVKFAQAKGQGSAAKEALFHGHFEAREDIGRIAGIEELLRRREVGVDLAALRAALEVGTHRGEVERDLSLAQELGISGVPLFIANLEGLDEGKAVAISGAQEVPVFKRFLDEAARRAA